jgi:hypothetical protein
MATPKRLPAVFAATLGLLGASDLRAADLTVFAKTGADAAELSRDQVECRALADKAYYRGPRDSDGRYGLSGAVIMSLAVAHLDAKAKADGVNVCMRRRGYARLALTPEETRAFQAHTDDHSLDVWMDHFLSGDIAARIAAALTPRVPPLPTAEDAGEPFTIRAVRIDPASLVPSTGAIRAGGDVLTGRLAPRRIAILTEDYRDSIAMTSFGARAGAVFQEYFEPTPWDPSLSEDQTSWCGMVGAPVPYCFLSTLEGYQVSFATGRAWLVGRSQNVNAFTRTFVKPLKLAVQPLSPQASLSFSLAVSRLTRDGIVLTATASKDNQTVEFWTATLKFDEEEARLPFWDRTLVLSRAADAVAVRFEPRAGGKGWLDAP